MHRTLTLIAAAAAVFACVPGTATATPSTTTTSTSTTRHRGATLPQGHTKHRRRDLVESGTLYVTPEQQNNTEVVAQVGGTATIKCYTHYLGDEMVTWLKRDEEHLLTAGATVYSMENRYSIAHVRHQKLWELSLRDVKLSDAGLYECQVTSHPPSSLFFFLKVVEARAVIQGGPEVHVHTGAKLRLHCTVELATEPLQYLFWYHNNTMINHRRSLRVTKHDYGSSLVIANVTWGDAGVYKCEPQNAKPASLTLHVLQGEKHAALHNGQGEGGGDGDDAGSRAWRCGLGEAWWAWLLLLAHALAHALAP